MENINIIGVHSKIGLLVRVHEKAIYRGDCLKGGSLYSLQI